MFEQAEMRRRLEFVIVRTATMEKAPASPHFETCRDGIHDEHVACLAIDIADAKDRVGHNWRSLRYC